MAHFNPRELPFWDPALPLEARIDNLIEQLSVDEKLRLMASSAQGVERLGIGPFAVGGEAAHGVEARNDQNELRVPEPTTSFPQPIGMSATWDPELIRKAGEVTGIEARVIHHRHPDRGLSRWAPTVDLCRDPRWGRTEEGYGEDPVLTGKMASAYIQGMQGDHPHYIRLAATLKHFYGNNNEVNRSWANVTIDPRNRTELYWEPFRRCCVEGKAQGVMTAYNKINGVPGIFNPEVKNFLKGQCGLTHAVSDGGAMGLVVNAHHANGLHAQTLATALKAGVDAMSDDPRMVEAAAREAYDLGLIGEKDLDESIRCMFRTKFRLGLYDREPRNPYDRVTEADLNSEAAQEISRQMARESLVLLKNDNGALPMGEAELAEAALIGHTGGDWYQDWYGGEPIRRVSLKDGMEQCSGKPVAYADGLDRVTLQAGDKYVSVDEEGYLHLSDQPCTFILNDWGEGSLTLQSAQTAKYLNVVLPFMPGMTQDPLGTVKADRDAPFSFLATGVFHWENGAEGPRQLLNVFDQPLSVDEAGNVHTMRGGEPLALTLTVVEDGIQKAVALAKEKARVVLSLGCSPMVNAKEEYDRKTIALPPHQEALLNAVTQANPNTVLVMISNYPYAMEAASQKVPAILWSCTGSQDMGEAIAQALMGRCAPAGRTNMTWYLDDSQLPPFDDYDIIQGGRTYRYFDGPVLYPFGYGLTYSSFAYGELSVSLWDAANLQVEFQVTNTGGTASDEVAQVYGVAPASRAKKPMRQLLAFTRLKDVQPGETRRVSLRIPVEELRFYDVISRTLMVEEGTYTLFAGRSSADDGLRQQVFIPGSCTGKRDVSRRTAADHYDQSENVELVEGLFGYSAAKAHCPEKPVTLTYRDVKADGPWKTAHLFLKSESATRVTLMQDGREIGCWEGETRTYQAHARPILGVAALGEKQAREKTQKPIFCDVNVPLTGGGEGQDILLTIRLEGDAQLCYFYME